MDNKVQCPKCKAVWPKDKKIKYCMCGQRLIDPVEFLVDLLGIDMFGKKKQGESDE